MKAQESMRTALELQGITNLAAVHHNLPTTFLYEEAARRSEGRLGHLGPLVLRTGHHTGRAPNDKFVVRRLAERVRENFRQFESGVSAAIASAGLPAGRGGPSGRRTHKPPGGREAKGKLAFRRLEVR